MKQLNFIFLLTLLMSMVESKTFAYDAMIDGIYYNFSGTKAIVTYGSSSADAYSGAVVIPESVLYSGKIYSVIGIGELAFGYCPSLTSITIPNSVTYIANRAFSGCI